jgi:hypothetical protein
MESRRVRPDTAEELILDIRTTKVPCPEQGVSAGVEIGLMVTLLLSWARAPKLQNNRTGQSRNSACLSQTTVAFVVMILLFLLIKKFLLIDCKYQPGLKFSQFKCQESGLQ